MSFDRDDTIGRISIFFSKKKRDTIFFVDKNSVWIYKYINSMLPVSTNVWFDVRFKSFVHFTGLIILLLINRKFLFSLFSLFRFSFFFFFFQKSRSNYNTRTNKLKQTILELNFIVIRFCRVKRTRLNDCWYVFLITYRRKMYNAGAFIGVTVKDKLETKVGLRSL